MPSIGGYLRSEPPGGGLRSSVGAARAAASDYAQTVRYTSGREMQNLGRSVGRLGEEIEKKDIEQGSFQANMALMKFHGEITESLRGFDATSHADENGIPQWENTAKTSMEGIRKRRQDYLKSIHPSLQDKFTLASEAELQTAEKAFGQKVETHKLNFIRSTLPKEVNRMAEDGDVQGAVMHLGRTMRDAPGAFNEVQAGEIADDIQRSYLKGLMYHSPEMAEKEIDKSSLPEEERRQMHEAIAADRKAARLASEEAEKERVKQNDRQGTVRILATTSTDPAIKNDPNFRPMTPSELLIGGMNGTYSEEMVKFGFNALTEPPKADPEKQMQAYAIVSEAYHQAAAGRGSMDAAWGAYYMYGKHLQQEDREQFVDKMNSTPDGLLSQYRNEAIKEADGYFPSTEGERKQVGITHNQVQDARGRVMRDLDTYLNKLDPAKVLDRAAITEQARVLGRREFNRLKAIGKPPKGAVPGLEDLWDEMTPAERDRTQRRYRDYKGTNWPAEIAAMRAARERRAQPASPLGIDVNQIPTNQMMGVQP